MTSYEFGMDCLENVILKIKSGHCENVIRYINRLINLYNF